MKKFPKPWYRPSRGVWYVTLNDQQINLGSDRDEAFRKYAQLLAAPQIGRQAPADSLLQVIDTFLEWVQKHRSPDTYIWYQQRLELFAQRYRDLRADEVRPYHVQQWVDSYPHLRQTTRRNYFRTVKRCFKWATQQGYLGSDPVQHLEVPGAERRETLITPEQYQQVLDLIRDEDFRDLVVVTWDTGCRPQESLRVEARHVDLERNRWVFPKSESKGKREPRIVYLSGQAAEITRRQMARHPTGPIFRNSEGKPWNPDSVNNQFNRLRVRLMQKLGLLDEKTLKREMELLIPKLSKHRKIKGKVVPKQEKEFRWEARQKVLEHFANRLLPRFSLYALRHAWATRALESGVDGLTVAILMGHRDPSTLARVYQHLSHNPEHLYQQAQRATGGT